jgi:hypothetical protein
MKRKGLESRRLFLVQGSALMLGGFGYTSLGQVFSSSPAFKGAAASQSKPASAPAGCSEIDNSLSTTDVSAHIYVGYASAHTFVCNQFVPANANICKASLYLNKVGTPTSQYLTLHIYTDNGSNNTGTLVASSSNTVLLSSLPTGPPATPSADFNFSATVTPSSLYWIVLEISAISGSIYVYWEFWGTPPGNLYYGYGANPTGLTTVLESTGGVGNGPGYIIYHS